MGVVKNIFKSNAPAQSRLSRRNMELGLLVLAALPAFFLFYLTASNVGNPVELSTFTYPIALFVAFLVIHIIMRIFAEGADPAILPIAYILVNIGMAFLVSLAPDVMALQIANNGEALFTPEDVFKHCIFVFMAVACLIAVVVITQKKFKMELLTRYSYIFMIIALVLLISPMMPIIGAEAYGARNTLHLGPISLQPNEFAKLFLILGLASYMAEHRELLSIFTVKAGPFKLPDFKTLAPMVIMWAIAMAIIAFEKDFGTAFVLFAIFLVMLYVATGKKFYVIVGVLFVVIGVSILLPFFSHIQVRIDNWLNPFADPQNAGYQMCQSLFSLADGGIFGSGIGLGLCYYVPEIDTDYIFTAIAEESGLFGAACVLMLYLSFAIRGYLVAARAKSDFACLVAVGMTSMIVLQAFIIVAGITRVIPLTGITLPFICRGGSSIIASFIALGFIARCGDEGTGVRTRMVNFFDTLDKKGLLGRYALGKRLTSTLIILSVLYVVLIGALISIMFVHAQEYQEMPANNHTMIHMANVKRGSISTSDGVVLAQSVETDDDQYSNYRREYPAGDLASQVVGYSSRQYGTAGIEDVCNGYLTGRSGNSFMSAASDLLGTTVAGNDVVLTIDSQIQQAAQDALDGYTGACVVLDANTGAVLAMASAPTYDAADFASVLEAAAEGNSEPVLLNRAIQSRYAPGSTFKTVTLTTALEYGVATPETMYNAPGTLDVAGKTVVNFDNEELGEISLAQAYALSSNTVFAQVGLQTGSEDFVEGAHAFGFDEDLDFELDVLISRMSDASEMGEWELAWAACGQPVGQNTANGPYATVLQMAMTGAAIANNGAIMKPYIVEEVHSPEGMQTYGVFPTVYRQACSGNTASKVEEMMRNVVENGTGTNAAIEGHVVYGKTGTAETNRESDDSWFVGYTECGGTDIVVAMVLEEAYSHGDGMNAAAHCRSVLEKAIEVKSK